MSAKQNFEQWTKWTAATTNKWTIDPIHNGLGNAALLVHRGGTNGVWARIERNGMVRLGTYEGAIPHIGEACFTVTLSNQCNGFNDAFARLSVKLGSQFLIQLMS